MIASQLILKLVEMIDSFGDKIVRVYDPSDGTRVDIHEITLASPRYVGEQPFFVIE